MPSDVLAALSDIERHIDFAVRFVEGLDYESFRDDTRTIFLP